MALTVCTGTVFALGEDVDISIGDDEDEEIVEPEIPSNVDSFENVSAGNVKVTIANNTEDLYMYNADKDTYSLVPTGPAPSGDKWGMFTNFAYPTHKLIDGEYVEIGGAYKKGAYCGDDLFPIKAIRVSISIPIIPIIIPIKHFFLLLR